MQYFCRHFPEKKPPASLIDGAGADTIQMLCMQTSELILTSLVTGWFPVAQEEPAAGRSDYCRSRVYMAKSGIGPGSVSFQVSELRLLVAPWSVCR